MQLSNLVHFELSTCLAKVRLFIVFLRCNDLARTVLNYIFITLEIYMNFVEN